MEKVKRVILYCRVSTTEQADHGYSLSVQEVRLENYCKLNGYEIALKVREDFSGKTFDRPQFHLILDFIKKNKGSVDELLIVTWDRYSRNTTEALEMTRTLLSYGVKANAIEQPIDVTIPEQKIMIVFYVASSDVDFERRSMNLKRGQRKASLNE